VRNPLRTRDGGSANLQTTVRRMRGAPIWTCTLEPGATNHLFHVEVFPRELKPSSRGNRSERSRSNVFLNKFDNLMIMALALFASVSARVAIPWRVLKMKWDGSAY
jgi:hypothetical protein